MSREVSVSGTAKHKSQTRRARIIRMVWGTEAMVCGKGYFIPNLSADYKEMLPFLTNLSYVSNC